MKDGYIPKEQRKTILLLSDDFRLPSGVGVMSREIVLGTAHRYNWVQVGAAVQHPEAGKILDISDSVNKEMGIPDAYVRIYPYNGYGDSQLIRSLLSMEKPHAIMHFTDPRYWLWLYEMEHELREHVPLLFYHVWDDTPFPKYNYPYYKSCDFIANISRQTYNIVKNVAPEFEPWQVQYIGHGINSKQFYKITDPQEKADLEKFRKSLVGDAKFVLTFNNRNIRRKMPGDIILAFREFVMGLPEKDRDSCVLLLHTQPSDDNGTDLRAVLRDCAPEIKAVFSDSRVDTATINRIYNISDGVINLASNEGFGLGTAEALMAGTMIIINVTGGLQDQAGFKDDKGEYLHEDTHYNSEWATNADGRYQECGEWCLPVFPSNRALIGSPPTPYIFDDRCRWEDAAVQIRALYDLGQEERDRRGQLGHDYVFYQGFEAGTMCEKFIDGIDTTFKNWKPRKRFELVKV
jgi:hypothetical protein